MKQSVYVMQSENGLVKVGVSRDPEKRRRTLQSASGLKVSLVHEQNSSADARLVEEVAHNLLASYRRRGEWFDVGLPDAIRAVEAAIEQIDNSGVVEWGPKFGVRVPLEIREQIEAEAEREGRTTSNMLVRLVSEALAARRKRK